MDGCIRRWNNFPGTWRLMTVEGGGGNTAPLDYRHFEMKQKPEGTGHINTVAGNHLAEVIWPPLFILGDGIKSLPPCRDPTTPRCPPSVVRTDLYQGPELARHQCPAVSSANVCSKNKLNSRSLLHHCATLFYYINEMVTLSTGLKGMILCTCVSPPPLPLPVFHLDDRNHRRSFVPAL